ncbi:MAG: leucine-rich repeat protein [Clostridia bacterium]|nr:leucine-rich repeat protein [Clostridia bacterium]
MKKMISVALACIIALAAIVNSSVTALSFDSNSMSSTQFAQGISKMLSDYSKLQLEYDETGFSTARLIVKSSRRIDPLNALSVVKGYNDLWILQFKTVEDAKTAYNYYSERSGIEYVEPDRPVSGAEVDYVPGQSAGEEDNGGDSEGPYLSWGPKHIGIDLLNDAIINKNYPAARTVVAVIDTGVNPDHEFLEGRIEPTKINTSNSGIRNDSRDDNGHGTAVASVIVDSTLDNIIVRPYKVLDRYSDGTIISVAAGINCAVDDGVDVINLSLCFEENSPVLEEAVRNAYEKDIVVVGAAGNHGSDEPHYPAAYDEIISVSAINQSNIIANFSNYGEYIDFAAPGVNIKVANITGGYVFLNGTSFSAPFVAALAATCRGVDPNGSAEDIEEVLRQNAVKIAETDAILKYGNGLLRAPEPISGYHPFDKAETPAFSVESGIYSKAQNVEISCATPGSVIYYTTDRSVPSKKNPAAKIYDGTPISINITTVVSAVAYAPDMHRSSVAVVSYMIAPLADSDDLIIDTNGILTKYQGDKFSITVPEMYNGITVKGVGDNAFKGTTLQEVILPQTVTSIGESAFEENTTIKTVYAKGVTKVGARAFYNCINLKNVFLNELTEIGEYSFYKACNYQYQVFGTTFNLSLNKITNVPEAAFAYSGLSSLECDYLDSIETDAFTECQALTTINIGFLMNAPNGAFKGCVSLDNAEIDGILYASTGFFSTCTNLRRVSLPSAIYIESNAFENCFSLEEVNLPKAKEIFSNSFSGCDSLRMLVLPEMKTFESSLYSAPAPNIKFPKNLTVFSAPKLEKTVMNMFSNTPDIYIVDLSGAKELAPYTFRGCKSLFILGLGSITEIGEKAFDGGTILFVDAQNLVSTKCLPDNGGIMLSNKFVESNDTVENLTVYGSAGTFVERYAKHKGYNFVEIPFVYGELPDYVTENSETVAATAIGFDLEYQWYWNTKKSTEGGTPIEGAVTEYYTFTSADTAPYYYCKITQHDLDKSTVVYSKIITKDSVPADYSAYNEAVAAANAINREHFVDLSELDALLKIDMSDRYSCEQQLVDEQTAKILEAIKKLEPNTVREIKIFNFKEKIGFLEKSKVIAVMEPSDAPFTDLKWSTEDSKLIYLNENGEILCIGHGTATVKATVTNIDGSVTEQVIHIECKLSLIDRLFAFWIRTFEFIMKEILLRYGMII